MCAGGVTCTRLRHYAVACVCGREPFGVGCAQGVMSGGVCGLMLFDTSLWPCEGSIPMSLTVEAAVAFLVRITYALL